MFKSIKNQLFLITALFVVIPFLLYSFFDYYFTMQDIKSKTKETSKSITLLVADNVESFIDRSYMLAEQLVDNSDVASFDSKRQGEVFYKVAGQYPYIALIYIQNTNGMQTANSLGAPKSNRSGRWWFKKFMLEKRPFVSKSYYTTTDNTTVTSIFMPTKNIKRELTGVLGIDLKLESIQRITEKLSLGKNSRTYVVDGEGTVLAHPDKQEVEEMYNYKTMTKTVLVRDNRGKPIRDKNNNHLTRQEKIVIPSKLREVTLEALKGQAGTTEYKDMGGNDVICAYAPISLPGHSDNWAVITVQEKQYALAMISGIIWRNLRLAFVILLLAILSIYLFAEKITRPLKLIDEKISLVSQGNLKEKVEGNFGNNEIGRLARSYEKMRSSLAQLHTERENLLLLTIEALIIALESKDGYTHNHSREVAKIVSRIAKEMELGEDQVFQVKFAALLHDIGKIGIPDIILNKVSKLTEEEWEVMKKHPGIGARIINLIPQLKEVAQAISLHHARWDGMGYPENISGDEIPLGARIIAVADAFQAMTSDRPYRKSLSFQEAVAEIRRCAGTQFDPLVVQAFLKAYG